MGASNVGSTSRDGRLRCASCGRDVVPPRWAVTTAYPRPLLHARFYTRVSGPERHWMAGVSASGSRGGRAALVIMSGFQARAREATRVCSLHFGFVTKRIQLISYFKTDSAATTTRTGTPLLQWPRHCGPLGLAGAAAAPQQGQLKQKIAAHLWPLQLCSSITAATAAHWQKLQPSSQAIAHTRPSGVPTSALLAQRNKR